MHQFNAGFGHRDPFAPTISDYIEGIAITTSSQAIPIPSGAKYVLLSATVNIAVKVGLSGVTAAFPETNTTTGTGSVINPAARAIPFGATHIAIIGADTGYASMEFYS